MHRDDLPSVMDLNVGMGKVKRKDDEKCKAERLDHLLRWISVNKQKFAVQGVDKVSRGNLAKDPPPLRHFQTRKWNAILSYFCVRAICGVMASSRHLNLLAKMKDLSTDFVCFRGCLAMIMKTPYERREAWTGTPLALLYRFVWKSQSFNTMQFPPFDGGTPFTSTKRKPLSKCLSASTLQSSRKR